MKRKAGSAIRTASDGLGDGSDGESRKKTKRERKGKVVDEGVNAIETAAEPLPAVVDDIAQDEAAPPTSTEPTDPPAEIGDGAKQKKKKKKSKKSGKGREGADAAKTEVADDSRPVEPTATEEAPKKEDEANGEAKAEADGDDAAAPTANHRFIVFVGNLPFTATTASVQAHFASVKPHSIRLGTKRDDPKKTRGWAFVEFSDPGHMKTALAKLHHSEFDDGVSPKRRINVELTAGGGGGTAKRKERIKAKNHKLNEQRARRFEAEKEAKAAKPKENKDGDDAKKTGAAEQQQHEEGNVHPSRRGRIHERKKGRNKKAVHASAKTG